MVAIIDRPQPGFYRTRLVKGGPWVAARIWWDDSIQDRPAMLLGEVAGEEADAWSLWPRVVGQQIAENEYRFMTADADWCRQNAPDEPQANPRRAVDLRTMAMPF